MGEGLGDIVEYFFLLHLNPVADAHNLYLRDMDWTSTNAELVILLNVTIAAVLAGLVGLEREFSDKPAGFRTHMIIGASAALLVSLGKLLVLSYSDLGISEYLRADPIRVIEAIIVGISFLGAGTILKQSHQGHILYLTTAATILMSASVGICVALESYVLAVGITVLMLVINFGLRYLERHPDSKDHEE